MHALTKLAAGLIGQLKPGRTKEPQLGDITLPPPGIEGAPLMRLLGRRQSRRDFATTPLPIQLLSDLLWAAFGVNRADTGGRTAPSALNAQEIDVYAALPGGLYLYDARMNELRRVADVDARRVTGYQDFVDEAPLDLIYVARQSLTAPVSREQRDIYAAACAGAIAQNVYLFCAAEGLATVVRGWFDRAGLGRAARLGPRQRVLLTQTVGYPLTIASAVTFRQDAPVEGSARVAEHSDLGGRGAYPRRSNGLQPNGSG
jgi:nitroreductase